LAASFDAPHDVPATHRTTQFAAVQGVPYNAIVGGTPLKLCIMVDAEDSTYAVPRKPRSMEPVLAHIQTHIAEPLSLERLAALTGLSIWRFATVFRERVGMPPHRYVSQLRVKHAQALLRKGVSVASVASEAGFYDQSHLARRFKRECGMTPTQYQSESRGEA
jgi:AraC-like DNA-binding protein